jgi:hypothetical protein
MNEQLQVLGIHFRRLRTMGFIQVGHDFANMTEAGRKVLGIAANSVIVWCMCHLRNA